MQTYIHIYVIEKILCEPFFFSITYICIVVVQSLSHVQLFATLWTLQYARLPCPLPRPRVCSNTCPVNHDKWCHPTISACVVPFSSCLQSFPPSGSFPIRQLFASGGRNIGASTSASVLPMNIQGWFPLWLTGLISLQSRELSGVFSSTTVQRHQFFGLSILYGPTLISVYDNWKNHSFD